MWGDLDKELESFDANVARSDPPAAAAPAAVTVPVVDDPPAPTIDLAALQRDAAAESKPPAAVPKPAADANALVDDLDALMVSLGKPKNQPSGGDAAPKSAPTQDERRKTMVVSTATDEACGACGGKISGEHLLAKDKVWHMEHFKCDTCSSAITGEFFEAGGKTVCIPCHDRDFRCSKCNQPLTGEYFTGDGQMFHPQCVDKKSCAKCHGEITTHNINALGQNWHPDCFVCNDCGSKLGTSFFSKDDKPFCENCINKSGLKTNVKCNECGRDVTGSYLTFGDKSFHTDCLKCFSCKQVLPGDAFYNVNNQPSCLECAQKASS
jgi:LIM domain